MTGPFCRRMLPAFFLVLLPIGPAPPEKAEDNKSQATAHQPSIAPVRSPGGNRAIHSEAFDPYAEEPAVFRIAEADSGELLHRITTHDVGRFIGCMSWLDNRYVLVESGTHLLILDAFQGVQAAHYPAMDATPSPGKEWVIFRLPRTPLYGPRPPGETDFIALAWKVPASSKGAGVWRGSVIHPVRRSLDPFVAYRTESDPARHLLVSPFAWSEDGQTVAFVEWHDQARWLMRFGFRTSRGVLDVEMWRWKIETSSLEEGGDAWVEGLEWSEDFKGLLIGSRGEQMKVDLDAEGWKALNSPVEPIPSPDGETSIVYEPFVPAQPADFLVMEEATGHILHRITIEEPGRRIGSMTWLDDRYAAVEADYHLVILDAHEGTVSLKAPAVLQSPAPDGRRVAFRLPRTPLYGPRPPGDTDFLGLAWRTEGDEGQPTWQAHVIYPDSAPMDGFIFYFADTPAERHLVSNPFLGWSPDSSSLAFVVWHQHAKWLVRIDLPVTNGELAPRAYRQKLANATAEEAYERWVSDLAWAEDGETIRVEVRGEVRQIAVSGAGWQPFPLGTGSQGRR